MLITYSLCTDSPKKPDTNIVLKQGEKIIQPQKINASQPETTGTWPNSPAYTSSVAAHFSYDAFDPKAPTTIIVIPPTWDRLHYDVDFTNTYYKIVWVKSGR